MNDNSTFTGFHVFQGVPLFRSFELCFSFLFDCVGVYVCWNFSRSCVTVCLMLTSILFNESTELFARIYRRLVCNTSVGFLLIRDK